MLMALPISIEAAMPRGEVSGPTKIVRSITVGKRARRTVRAIFHGAGAAASVRSCPDEPRAEAVLQVLQVEVADLRPELLDPAGPFGRVEPAGQGLLVVEVDQHDPLVAPARGRGEDVGAAVAGEPLGGAGGLALPFEEGRPRRRGGHAAPRPRRIARRARPGLGCSRSPSEALRSIGYTEINRCLEGATSGGPDRPDPGHPVATQAPAFLYARRPAIQVSSTLRSSPTDHDPEEELGRLVHGLGAVAAGDERLVPAHGRLARRSSRGPRSRPPCPCRSCPARRRGRGPGRRRAWPGRSRDRATSLLRSASARSCSRGLTEPSSMVLLHMPTL